MQHILFRRSDLLHCRKTKRNCLLKKKIVIKIRNDGNATNNRMKFRRTL